MHAVIIKGNPKFIKTKVARDYYNDIERFLKRNGVRKVTVDPGKDQTLPDLKADFYVAHSRGVGRYPYMPEDKKPYFLKFGSLDGVIHPVDRTWQEKLEKGEDAGDIPDEHFLFFSEQQKAIVEMIGKVKAKKKRKKSFMEY